MNCYFLNLNIKAITSSQLKGRVEGHCRCNNDEANDEEERRHFEFILLLAVKLLLYVSDLKINPRVLLRQPLKNRDGVQVQLPTAKTK